MFKREIKVNFKNFLVWLGLLIILFLVVFLVYPSIADSENVKSINEMMKIFPQELLKAFNMDLSSMESAYGWLKSEGFILILLIINCYAAIIGSNILLKEESDKTIEYLNSLPIKRNDIILNKVLASVIYIVSITIILGIFNFICLYFSGSFDMKQYILLSITPIFPSLSIFFICMFISTFTHKTKKMLGISLGIVFVSYVFQILSTLSNVTEFFKYFSVFTLADIRNVIVTSSINPIMIIVTLGISFIFLALTVIRYNKKELV